MFCSRNNAFFPPLPSSSTAVPKQCPGKKIKTTLCFDRARVSPLFSTLHDDTIPKTKMTITENIIQCGDTV